ncbi:MAG: single-stranded DNA-binding protein [Vampirovibrionales bacterium]
MTFARITLAGQVIASPEKRFTSNNTAITALELEVSPAPRGNQAVQPYKVKVTTFGRLAEGVADAVQAGQWVLVEGRLVVQATPADDGTPRKVMEIEANQVTVASNLQVIGAGMDMPTTTSAQASPSASSLPMAAAAVASSPASGTLFTDDDIPF